MLKELFRFERDKYFHSSRMILPLILLFFYLGFAYSMAPQYVLDSFSICSLVVFLLMLSVGIMYDDINYPMIDQTIFIKTEKKEQIFGARCVLIAYISFGASAACVVYPVLVDLAGRGNLFMRPLRLEDLISAFFLFWLIGICGGVTGLFANSRLFKKREAALLLGALLGLVIILKGPIGEEFPPTRLLTWILPPVYDLSVNYCKEDYFSLSANGIYFLWLAGYTGIEIFLYIWLMKRKKFE